MQTTANRTVANSLPKNEVILLTLLISKRYIPYTDLRKISGISAELQQIKTKVRFSYHYPIILLQQSCTWIHTAHSYHSRTDNNRKTQESQEKADERQRKKTIPCACVPLIYLHVRNWSPTTTVMQKQWKNTDCNETYVVRKHGIRQRPNTTVI